MVRTPGAGIGDIEMISAFFRGELCSRLLRDVVSELGLSPSEFAGLIGPIGD